MKIAVLNGAKKNAGDFLIKERSIEILKKNFPNSDIQEIYRNELDNEKVGLMNECDLVVVAGGPMINREFYDLIFGKIDIDDIKKPILCIGIGSYMTDFLFDLYSYKIGDGMRKLFSRSIRDCGYIGCRDYLSVNLLRNNRIDNTIMTGCPAWYDYDNLNEIKYKGKKLEKIEKICISDIGTKRNFNQLKDVIEFAAKFFSYASITVVFHRGIDEYPDEFFEYLNLNKINIQDISNGVDGLKVYDEADLHIGFRVHAHIYNLSKRKLSVLICEDSRGVGVDSTLGLPVIRTYDTIIDNPNEIYENKYLKFQLEDYFMNLIDSNYKIIENAYENMNHYYENMEKLLGNVRNIII